MSREISLLWSHEYIPHWMFEIKFRGSVHYCVWVLRPGAHRFRLGRNETSYVLVPPLKLGVSRSTVFCAVANPTIVISHPLNSQFASTVRSNRCRPVLSLFKCSFMWARSDRREVIPPGYTALAYWSCGRKYFGGRCSGLTTNF